MKPDPRSTLQVATGAMFISFAAPIVKQVVVGPTVSAFYRMLFGALGLLLLLALNGRWRHGWRHGWGASGVIAFFFALDLWFWHRSVIWLGPGLATLLANFQVFILPLGAWLLSGECAGGRFYSALALAAAGLWLMFGLDWQAFTAENRLGIAFGLLTAAAYAAYILSLQAAQRQPGAPATVARLFQVTVLTTLLIGLSAGLEGHTLAVPAAGDWALLVAYGLLCQVLGWLLITRGLPALPAAVAGLLLLLQPSLSMVWDVLFFSLTLGPWQWAGVVLALGGIYLGSARGRRTAR